MAVTTTTPVSRTSPTANADAAAPIPFPTGAVIPFPTGEVAVPHYARRGGAHSAPTVLARVRSAEVTLTGWRLALSGTATLLLAVSTVIAWAVQR